MVVYAVYVQVQCVKVKEVWTSIGLINRDSGGSGVVKCTVEPSGAVVGLIQ